MVMNPTYFSGFTGTPVGKLMIGVSIGMELTGFFVINKIVDIQY